MTRPARFEFPNPPPVLGSPSFGNDAQGYLGAFPALRDYIEATADWYETDFAKSLPNGTAALPSLAFTAQANTGLYRPATSVLAISVNGTERARFTTTGMQVGGSEVFRRANILGTVSQSAGVPTGAIIQRGSNANGEFVRFADGTQICHIDEGMDTKSDVSLGAGFRSDSTSFTWPAAFVEPPSASVTVKSIFSWANVTSVQNGIVSVRLFSFTDGSSTPEREVRIIGIGRWF